MKIKAYLLGMRAPFLLLPVVLVLLGTGMAQAAGVFHPLFSVLCLLGLLLLHISVNTLNEFHDFRSGIDLETNRTPFSGGSGQLPGGGLRPEMVLRVGVVSFLLAVPVGVFFLFARGWALLPVFVLGAVFVLAYTPLLTRVGWGASEVSAGLGLGTLPVVGTAYILTGAFTAGMLYASIPSGLLVANLLILNEIPDVDADRRGGRRTLAILLGRRGAAAVYAGLTAATYLWIVAGTAAGIMPVWTLLGCLTIPLALKAAAGGFAFEDRKAFTAAQGANVAVVLLTQLLMGAGFFLEGLLR